MMNLYEFEIFKTVHSPFNAFTGNSFHFQTLPDLVHVILLSAVLPRLVYTPLPSVMILSRKALGKSRTPQMYRLI